MSKKQPTNTEKKIGGKKLWENRFLKHLRTSSRKVWTIRLNLLAGLSKLLSKCSDEPFSGRFSGMKKLCSSFLVVERIYWTFGVTFFVKILKAAAYGCSGTFWGFFRREEKLFGPFRFLSESNHLLAKNLWQVAESEFQVSSAELWENMINVIHTINIFFRTLIEFFLILAKKNSQVCRNSNLSVQGKNVEKDSWTIGFLSFFDFD